MNNNYNKYFTDTEAGLDIEANNINANCITSQNNKFSLDSEGNLMVNSITAKNQNQNNLDFDSIYPIGSIYMNISDINPSSLFGGTWEQIAKGRTLVGVDSSDTDFNDSQKTGGEKMHKLTVEELPPHNHKIIGYFGAGQWAYGNIWLRAADASDGNVRHDTSSLDTGGNQYHNNMQPYFTCYIWLRTK